jgi:hypothetical protein
MSLPGVVVNVLNGNLGLSAANAERSIIYAGVSTGGVPNTLSAYGDVQAMTAAQGAGEVLEAAAYGLSVSGGQVAILNLPPTIAGATSSVTSHLGAGSTGVLTTAQNPHLSILVTVTTGGALGTAQATFQVGGGVTPPPVAIPGGGTYLVPGTYCTLTFPSGTYVVADTYSIGTTGTVVHTGSGPSGVTQASSPLRPVAA